MSQTTKIIIALVVLVLIVIVGYFVMTMSQTRSSPVSPGANVTPQQNSGTLPIVSVVASDAQAAESGSMPADPASFTVTRTGDVAQTLTVSVELLGIAETNADYTHTLAGVPGGYQVTIPAHTASLAVPIMVTDDKMMEEPETVVFAISEGGTYSLGDLADAAVIILDSDDPAIQVIAPNGGESLCIGGLVDVAWKSQGVNEVSITLMRYEPSGGGSGILLKKVSIQDPKARAEHGITWDGIPTWGRAAFTITESSSYAIRLSGSALKPGVPGVDDLSEEYFALKVCESSESSESL